MDQSHPVPLTFLRQILKLDDVRYGESRPCKITWPLTFAGGESAGNARTVLAEGEVLVRDTAGLPILVQRPYGRGSILLAGYDCESDSPDGDHRYERDAYIGQHSLNQLCLHLGIVPRNLRTGQLFVAKEVLTRAGKDYLIMFSHLPETIMASAQVKLNKPSTHAYDLATGQRFPVKPHPEGWVSLEIPLHTRVGRYLSFHD